MSKYKVLKKKGKCLLLFFLLFNLLRFAFAFPPFITTSLPPSFLVSLSLQYFNSLIISTFFSLILSSLPCFASIHYWILMVNKTCSYSEVFLGINLTSCANLDIFFVLIKIWVIQCNILIHSLIHSCIKICIYLNFLHFYIFQSFKEYYVQVLKLLQNKTNLKEKQILTDSKNKAHWSS